MTARIDRLDVPAAPIRELADHLPSSNKTWKVAALIFGVVTAGALVIYFAVRFLVCAPFSDKAGQDFRDDMARIAADIAEKQKAWQTA